MLTPSGLIRKIRRRPVALEETLVDPEGTLVDAEVNNRRITYTHERRPERGVLTLYREGDRVNPQFVFYDAHIPLDPEQRRKDLPRALEEVVFFHDDGSQEVFRSPRNGTFEYVDRYSNRFPGTVHDPVARAVVDQARERYGALSKWYESLLKEVQQEARKKVIL
ncbi:hypothetical protein HYX02_08350 [Candidatus Woesearchaeota archaeon]|nr:hypothetical protein [Candidatus Woesearchaeota archaeon]